MIRILRLKYWYAVMCAVSKFDGSVYDLCSLDQIFQNYCGYFDKWAVTAIKYLSGVGILRESLECKLCCPCCLVEDSYTCLSAEENPQRFIVHNVTLCSNCSLTVAWPQPDGSIYIWTMVTLWKPFDPLCIPAKCKLKARTSSSANQCMFFLTAKEAILYSSCSWNFGVTHGFNSPAFWIC